MSWDDCNTALNAATLDAFGTTITLHFEGYDLPIEGVFDQKGEQVKIKGGGCITRAETTLSLSVSAANGVARGFQLTVKGKRWMVAKPPKPDGDGEIILVLGEVNRNEPELDLRY